MYLEINKKISDFCSSQGKNEGSHFACHARGVLTIFNNKGEFFHVFYERGRPKISPEKKGLNYQ